MKRIAGLGVVVVLAAVGVWLLLPQGAPKASSPVRVGASGEAASQPLVRKTPDTTSPGGKAPAAPARAAADEEEPSDPPQTDEEKAEAAAEAKVDAFDDLTDKWMDPSKAGVTMKDVDGFVAAFRQVPKDRQDECIHRALNLIPDENVMLLAGVLMDKTMDKDVVETVFNDVLNRDEDVKKPILQQIFKDKTHPCWTDTAWILDVTGEVPAKARQ